MDRPPQDPSEPDAPRPVKPKTVPPVPVRPKEGPARPAKPKVVPVGPATPVKPARPESAAPRPKAAKGRRRRRGPRRVPAAAPAPQPEPARPAAPTRTEVQDDPLIGTTIGRCRLEALVGGGKTARVYRAQYEALHDTVAVKILRSDVAHHPQLVERFHSEARAIAKVDNENVPKIYDVGIENDRHYMVVELLEGEEILLLIEREQQVELMDALRIVRQAANGLRAAHSHGLVHRDIKPQNLFLLEDGTVKVVDFGLAARFDDHSERVGTPHYMAPEVCKSGNAELASDIYGLGIVLYHLLVGQPPYAGQDIRTIMQSHMEGPPLRPERQRRGLPSEVSELVRRMTKRDPLLRPTADELIQELDQIGGEALEEKDTLKRRRHRSRARSAVARRERAGRKAPALVAILLVFLAIGVAVVVLATPGQDRPASTEGADVEPAVPMVPGDLPAEEVVEPPAPEVPAAPPETTADREAREAREKLERLEKEAAEALTRAEQHARDTWHAIEDNDAVRQMYLSVYERYRVTNAGKEALRRARGIKKGSIHPHPDMQWSDQDAIQAARSRWQRLLPEIESAIQKHDYRTAQTQVPEPLSGLGREAAAFTHELDFWREYTAELAEFQRELPKAVMELPADERKIRTPDGVQAIARISESGIETKVAFTTKTYVWSSLEPGAIADLAQRAFTDKGARHLVLLTAFAYAHMLKDAFFDAQLWLGATPGAREFEHQVKEYAERFEKRALGGG